MKKSSFFANFFYKISCNLQQSIIYSKSLLKKAMKQEVAELSGNFCRELSVPETGEGILVLFALCKKI